MRKGWMRVTLIVGLVLLPVLWWGIGEYFAAPREVRIGTGPGKGLYINIVKCLKEMLEDEGLRVTEVKTEGSQENMRLLQEGMVDFALYQTGTVESLGGAEALFRRLDTGEDGSLDLMEFLRGREAKDEAKQAFRSLDNNGDGLLGTEEFSGNEVVESVANVHYEVANVFLKTGPPPSPKLFSIGASMSGDRAMSQFLIDSLKALDIETVEWDYESVQQGMRKGSLYGAVIAAGTNAPILRSVARLGTYELWDNEFAEALTKADPRLVNSTIPVGMYQTHPPVPSVDTRTIALKAQILTRRAVSTRLVTIVTEIVLRRKFATKNGLRDLFEGGRDFAMSSLEFETHEGALGVYDPVIHPLLPTELVESTEGIRSFTMSFLIGSFFALRWWRRRRALRTEHRLDRFIRLLLEIERRQMPLDLTAGSDDLESLQKLLDAVTRLRQDALSELSTHELNEERGVACFVEMCHDLTQKINAKIARQHFDLQFSKLAEAIQPCEAEDSTGDRDGVGGIAPKGDEG